MRRENVKNSTGSDFREGQVLNLLLPTGIIRGHEVYGRIRPKSIVGAAILPNVDTRGD